MFNRNLRFFCPALVSIFGLASCAPDTKPKEVYTAPPPQIIKVGGSNVELKDWDRSAQKDLDLQDLLNVRGGAPSAIDVVTRCRRGFSDSYHETKMKAVETISIYQILPPEILATDLKAQFAVCSFEIALKNQGGSKHVFNMSAATIRDERKAPAYLTRNGEPIAKPRERFYTRSTDRVMLRDPNGLNGTAAIFCEDARSKELAYPTVSDLFEFDYARMDNYANRLANILEVRALQLCRGVILRDNVVQSMTEVFELQFYRAPLKITATNLPFRTPSASINQLHALFLGSGAHTGDYRIENPSGAPRWFRLPKAGHKIHLVRIPISRETFVPFISGVVRPYLFVSPANVSPSQIVEQQSQWLVTVPARGAVQISADIRARPLGCTMGSYILLRTEMLEPLVIEEVNEASLSLGKVSQDLGPHLYLSSRVDGTHGLQRDARPFTDTLCDW